MIRLRVDHPAQLCATDQAQRLRMQNRLLSLPKPIRYDTGVLNPKSTFVQENARAVTRVHPVQEWLCTGVASEHGERLYAHLSHWLISRYVQPVRGIGTAECLPVQVLFSKCARNLSPPGEHPSQGQGPMVQSQWPRKPTYGDQSTRPKMKRAITAKRYGARYDRHVRVKPCAKRWAGDLFPCVQEGPGGILLSWVQLRTGSWRDGALSAREPAQCLIGQPVRVLAPEQAGLCSSHHERLGAGIREAQWARREPS